MPNHQLPHFANGFQKIFCKGAFLDGLLKLVTTSQIDLSSGEATRRAGGDDGGQRIRNSGSLVGLKFHHHHQN